MPTPLLKGNIPNKNVAPMNKAYRLPCPKKTGLSPLLLKLLVLYYHCTSTALLYYYCTTTAIRRYCTTTVLLLYYYCTTAVLLLYYCCTTAVLLLYYCCTTTVLLLYYYCTTTVLLLYYYCTTTVLLLYYYCTTSVLHCTTTVLLLYYYCTTVLISISFPASKVLQTPKQGYPQNPPTRSCFFRSPGFWGEAYDLVTLITGRGLLIRFPHYIGTGKRCAFNRQVCHGELEEISAAATVLKLCLQPGKRKADLWYSRVCLFRNKEGLPGLLVTGEKLDSAVAHASTSHDARRFALKLGTRWIRLGCRLHQCRAMIFCTWQALATR